MMMILKILSVYYLLTIAGLALPTIIETLVDAFKRNI